MKVLSLAIFSLWIFYDYVTETAAQFSRTNFNVKRFNVCNTNRSLIKFSGNITKENNNQYLNAILTTPIPFDENLGVNCLIETQVNKNTFAELFTVREKNACKAGNTFLGEFWYDIERAARVPPGICPVPPGKYTMRHHKLDFTKISLQTFPFGTLRFTVNGVDNRNKTADLVCFILEVENKI